jgi:hypothetical protein
MTGEDKMKRSFVLKLFGLFVVVGLTLGSAGFIPVQAAGENQANLTLANLGMPAPQVLTGPVSEYSLNFNMPVNWLPDGKVTLDVDLSAFFSSLLATESTTTISGLVGGNISFYLNDTLIGGTTLTQAGDQTIHAEFDGSLFHPATRQGVNTLRILWDGSISCSMNLLSSITVSPSSKLNFSYGTNPNVPSLNDFPAPFIIENSVQPVPLKIILPVNPTAGELRAAVILAAGVGQISGGKLTVDLVSLADYNPLPTLKQNVILVANNDTAKTLPSSLGIAQGPQPAAGEGSLSFFAPQGGYGLLVSGDETGIVKAAQVVSANQVIATGNGQSMVVSGVNPSPETTVQEDMTLADLGTGEMVFTRPDKLVQSVDFFVPAGNQVRADASFDLTISHSQQLDYLNSGLEVKVNGFPAVSLRLNDNTSNQALFTLILPANLIHAGRNSVEFTATLNTRDLCTAPTEAVAWLRVSSSSLLHLPLESAVNSTGLAKTFGDFPETFLSGSGMNDVSIVVAPGDFGNIQAAVKLADKLGAALLSGTIIQLNALFSNSADAAKAADSSMILIGKPSDFKGLADKSEFPSLVFNADNSLSEQSSLELVSKPETGADVGYLAIRGFNAPSNRILMAVMGNDSAGVGFAVNAVTSLKAAPNNFVMVIAKNVQTGWMDTGIATGEAAPSSTQTTPVTAIVNPVQVFKTSLLEWAMPALAILLAIMLLFLYVEIRQSIRKSK